MGKTKWIRMKCLACGKWIKVEDLGALSKDGAYHKWLPCILELNRNTKELTNAK